MKIPQNLWFSDIFRGYKTETLVRIMLRTDIMRKTQGRRRNYHQHYLLLTFPCSNIYSKPLHKIRRDEDPCQWTALPQFIYESRYSRMDQVKFVEDSLQKIGSDMVCLSRPYHFKFFKGCYPRILIGLFLNTLTQMEVETIIVTRVHLHYIKNGTFAI